MAECGPSNPLQGFRKHTAADRTLQQDRFTSSSPAAESFRSNSHHPGHADAQFNAFLSGHNSPLPFTNSPFHPPPEAQRSGNPFAAQRAFHQPQVAPDWAADFQNLHVSSPAPQAAARHNAFHPADFHAHMNAQEQQIQPMAEPSYRQEQPMQYSQGGTMADFSMPMQHFQQQNFQHLFHQRQQDQIQSPIQQQQQQQQAGPSHQTLDSAAFERAFADYDYEANIAQASKQEGEDLSLLNSTALHTRTEHDHDIDTSHSALHMSINDPREASAYPLGQEEQQQAQDNLDSSRNDDLANTARELLTRVSDNTSEKFAKSSFLALMRQLRDGEVKVEGEKMVETAGGRDVNEGIEEVDVVASDNVESVMQYA